MLGQTVCKMHGGKSPQALKSAQERIAAMVDPALAQLARLVEQADSDSVKLSAIKDVLDRAGYKPKDRVEHAGGTTIRVVYDDGSLTTAALGTAADTE